MSLLFDFAPWIGGAVLALLAFFGVKGAGKKEARAERAVKDAKAAQKTHERMNDAKTSDGMHSDDVSEWLRERGKRNNGA